MWRRFINSEIMARVEQMELSFNKYGLDPYGISKDHLGLFFTFLSKLYRHYFSVTVSGQENIPPSGRAMVVGNHSGGIAVDGGMVIASLFLELNPPRLGQGMVEKFINALPFASIWSNRLGQLTGLPEHATHLLEDERLLLVFPEGAHGTAKLYKDRYSLVRFGTGFVRLALQTHTPIIPFAFIGGGEVFPTISNLRTLGRWIGLPYIPITPYLLPIPLPKACQIHYGKPMIFEGDGFENDDVIEGYAEQVKEAIADLIEKGKQARLHART
jgi:1-acyl-sn-glycerol-3-phosphate acyltransferase